MNEGIGFGAALLMGLGFGAGPCAISCLPYLGPLFLAGDGGARGAWRILLPFGAGRLFGYSLLGLIAGSAGVWLESLLTTLEGRWLLGAATIAVALALLRRRRECGVPEGSVVPMTVAFDRGTRESTLMPGGLFLMGAGMALNPCAPLSALLLAAAASGSAAVGGMLGLGFAIGAVALPTLLFAFGVAHLGDQIRAHLRARRQTLERAGAGLLLLLGAATALGWTTP